MEEDKKKVLLDKLSGLVKEISEINEFQCVIKKECSNLSRRLRLLAPLFEELEEIKERISEANMNVLVFLTDALVKAKDLLSFGCLGSKIYMVLERDQITCKFQELAVHFSELLSQISFDKLDISDEVKEQVELVHAQFGRAQQLDSYNLELSEEISLINNHSNDENTDPAVLHKLCAKLNLINTEDLEKESLALNEMIAGSGGSLGHNTEKMRLLLKIVEVFLLAENGNSSISASSTCPDGLMSDQSSQSPFIPDDFRCPISLELMKDPVIISTGQTYERSCIKKWLGTGHRTCPKTREILSGTTLIPNHVLCSLISNWCEANGVEPPRRFGTLRLSKSVAASCSEEMELDALLIKLTSSNIENQRLAAGELRRLAKYNSDNRLCIAEAGAIPLLAELLYANDSLTQEHAVTALLNLSICEGNKGSIISSGAVHGILYVLKNGSMEARENAAANFFSLSVVDAYKVIIGSSGAIPALVTLLREGSQRGKVDAATALFNLCIYQGNKGRAVRAGVVPLLVTLLTEPGSGMVDEALAIMAILSSHSDAKVTLGMLNVLPTLVELVKNGSPRNRENAAAVLVHLCVGDPQQLLEAIEHGIKDLLLELAENGTERGKRKAAQLLELIGSFTMEQEQAQSQTDSPPQVQPSESPSLTSSTDNSIRHCLWWVVHEHDFNFLRACRFGVITA